LCVAELRVLSTVVPVVSDVPSWKQKSTTTTPLATTGTVYTCNHCWSYVLATCKRLFEPLIVVVLIKKIMVSMHRRRSDWNSGGTHNGT